MEAQGHGFEGDEAGCGEDACLAHAAAEGFAVDAGFCDGFFAADEHGANRGAEAFRKAEHDGVEAAGEGAGVFEDVARKGGGGVEDAGSVEVDGEAAFAGFGPDLFEDREGRYGAAGEVGGVLKLDEGGGGAEGATSRVDDGLDVSPGEDAAVGDSTGRMRQPEKDAAMAISQSRM